MIGRHLPFGKAANAGDGVGGEPAARVGRDQAETVDAARCVGVMAEGEQAAERDAAQPDFFVTLLAGRFEDFGLQGGERRAAGALQGRGGSAGLRIRIGREGIPAFGSRVRKDYN